MPPRDGGTDAGAEAGPVDAPQDTAVETGVDVLSDAPDDLGVDASADTGVDAGFDASVDVPRDTGMDVPRDTGVDVPRDTGMDVPRDTGMDVPRDLGVDVGFDPAPTTSPRPLRPAANARMLGRRIRFEAEFPTGALSPTLVILSRECVIEQARHPMSGSTLDLTVDPGVVCWRVLYRRPGGDEVLSAPRRLWAVSRGASTELARIAGLFPDYDRTGPADVLVGYADGRASGVRLQPMGTPTAAATAMISAPGTVGQITQGWHVGDLNGDGYGDAVLRVQQGSAWSLVTAYGSANGLSGSLTLLHLASTVTEPGFGSLVGPLADLDGDGRPDLVSVVYGMTPRYYIYRSTTEYQAPTPTDISPLDAPVTLAVVGPPLRPGDAGSLFIRGARGVRALLGTAPSMAVDDGSTNDRVAQVLLAVGGDMNNDGVPEVAVYSSSGHQVISYQYNSATGAFESVARAGFGTEIRLSASALIAPGPYMAANTDYIALLTPQGTLGSIGGFQLLTHDSSPTGPFAATLGPVGNDGQGAFGTLLVEDDRAFLTTLTVFTPGTFAVTRYTGLEAATLTWMAP